MKYNATEFLLIKKKCFLLRFETKEDAQRVLLEGLAAHLETFGIEDVYYGLFHEYKSPLRDFSTSVLKFDED